MQPSEPRWQLLVARCYRQAGNYPAALQSYRDVHRRFPWHVNCLRMLTLVCADVHLDDEARRYVVKLRRAEKTERLVRVVPLYQFMLSAHVEQK